MSDNLDRPITLRQLVEAFGKINTYKTGGLGRLVDQLVADTTQTDFIGVRFGGSREYVYRVAEQPARRVQVGDLVTVPPNSSVDQPQVARVTAINVPRSAFVSAVAVAISPEDAKRIETSLGSVR